MADISDLRTDMNSAHYGQTAFYSSTLSLVNTTHRNNNCQKSHFDGNGLSRGGGTSTSDFSGMCLPLGSPFSEKIPEQDSNFVQNARTGIPKAYDFPKRVNFFSEAPLLVSEKQCPDAYPGYTSCLIFPGMSFHQYFSRTSQKNFPC